MRHPYRHGRRRCGIRPTVERIESRELPSGLSAAVIGHHLTKVHTLATGSGSGSSAGGSSNPMPSAQPTPHEVARERFIALYQGSYTVGAPRFVGDRQLIFFLGFGNANQMRHTGLKIALTLPADPTAPITGQAQLEDRNISATGNFLGLTLQASPQGPLSHGLPTQLTWTVSSGGGRYVDATGQGTLQLSYTPSGRLPQRATGAGSFGAVFKGQVNASGVFNAYPVF